MKIFQVLVKNLCDMDLLTGFFAHGLSKSDLYIKYANYKKLACPLKKKKLVSKSSFVI